MKKLGIIAVALTVAMSAVAQNVEVKDNPRYGNTPEERIEVAEKMNIYTGFYKSQDYKEAYEQGWKDVFEKAPLASVNTYNYGVKILRSLYNDARKEQNAEKMAQYSEELFKVYEQRLQYLEQLNAQSTKVKATPGEIWGQYGHDYRSYNPRVQVSRAYELLRKAVDMGKGESQYYVLEDLMKVSSQRYKNKKDNDEYREALIQDYLDCAGYIDEYIANSATEQTLEPAKKTKENIDVIFIESGVADCETLQGIYAPKIEDKKDDLEYLTKVVKIMSLFKCESSDAYFAAAEYAHNIQPTAQTAISLGNLYIKQREDMDKALEYYNQALELDQDNLSQADTYYKISTIYYSRKKYDNSRSALQKCIAKNPNKGDAYIQMALLYAANYEWSNESALNLCAFFAVLDKLEQAKKVDPSVAEKANSLIKKYKESTPKAEDLFMLGYKAGDQLEIKGWINETVTIR